MTAGSADGDGEAQGPRGCAICAGRAFETIDELSVGWWECAKPELERVSHRTVIGRCRHCGHVQAIDALTPERVAALYRPEAHDRRPLATLLSDNAVSAYGRLLDFCRPEVAFDTLRTAADFGCGPGWLLAALHRDHGLPPSNLHGVDFQVRAPLEFPIIAADLNVAAAGDHRIGGLPAELDFAACLMMLEHAIDPRAVLRLIGRHLRDGACLLVLVPDAESRMAPQWCGEVPLIHPHHLHYFTRASLAALTATAGYAVVRTGIVPDDACPGLLALLRKDGGFGAVEAVRHSLESIRERYRRAARVIDGLLDRDGTVRLWGAGNDLTAMLRESGSLRKALRQDGTARVFDGSLHGHTLHGRQIENTADLAGDRNGRWTIVLTPMQRSVRASMMDFARRHGFHERVTDPYQ